MMKMVERLTTGLTRAWNWLRGFFGGSRIRAWIVSYSPWTAALVASLPIAFMPWLFGLSVWAYFFTLPLGFTAGVLAYLGAALMLDDDVYDGFH